METSLRKYSEQELLRMLDYDPHTGMAAMVEQYTGLLWHVAEHHLKNPEDIKECVNDTFLEFYIHRERFDSKKGTLADPIARNDAKIPQQRVGAGGQHGQQAQEQEAQQQHPHLRQASLMALFYG